MPAIAQNAPIKLGYVSPQTGPLAAFAEADKFIIDSFLAATKATGLNYRGRRQGQPVQPQPRGGSRQGADRQRRDQSDAGRLDAGDHQSGRHDLRGRGDALHFDGRAVAALVHRPAGQSGRPGVAGSRSTTPIISSGGSRTSSPSSPTCGRSSRPTRRSAACSPMTATAMPGATVRSASRRCWKRSATALTDPGRYQNLTDDFSAQINAFKAAQLRDHHRRDDPAGFHHLLEPGQAAGFQAEDRLDRQGDPVPAIGRGARQCRPQSVVGSLVVAEPSVQIVADRRKSGRGRRRLHQGDRPALDAADRLRPCAVRAGGRRDEARRGPVQGRRGRGRRSPRPSSTRSSGRSPGTARTCRPLPPRTSPRRRWSAASGG